MISSSLLCTFPTVFPSAATQHTSHCPLGIYVQPSSASLLVWDGVFFIHKGLFGLKLSIFANSCRLLQRCRSQVSSHLSIELPRRSTSGSLYNRCISSTSLTKGWNVFIGTEIGFLETEGASCFRRLVLDQVCIQETRSRSTQGERLS